MQQKVALDLNIYLVLQSIGVVLEHIRYLSWSLNIVYLGQFYVIFGLICRFK